MKTKICGIMRPGDGVFATEAGADFVGMIFVPGRHRRINASRGRAIAQAVKAASPPGQTPKIVGNFADQSQEEVNQYVMECGLDFVQLCGQETVAYCGQIDAEVIKVVHVDQSANATEDLDQVAERVRTYVGVGHLVTLDRLVVGVQGGTGNSFDWSIAAQLSEMGLPFILAGGLTPRNVAQAITQVQPWGVDVSSGVETSGMKNHDKIQAFIRRANRVASKS